VSAATTTPDGSVCNALHVERLHWQRTCELLLLLCGGQPLHWQVCLPCIGAADRPTCSSHHGHWPVVLRHSHSMYPCPLCFDGRVLLLPPPTTGRQAGGHCCPGISVGGPQPAAAAHTPLTAGGRRLAAAVHHHHHHSGLPGAVGARGNGLSRAGPVVGWDFGEEHVVPTQQSTPPNDRGIACKGNKARTDWLHTAATQP
jgi:hypothetical protein